MSKIPGLRADPFTAFRFYITLIDSSSTLRKVLSGISAIANYAVGSFSECTGLEMSMEIHEYKEGGVNDFVHKFATRANFSNITLKRGMGFTDDLWIWHDEYIRGKGKRRDGIIALLSEMGTPVPVPVKVWRFEKAIPVKWSGPSFDATQNAVAIEALEITHQGLKLLSPHATAARELGI
jgi:phage tail-like protein